MGGREIVKTKATATGTTLTGGEQIVEGVANETTINDGGIQTVSANGEAIKTKINEGGTLTVNDNGKATDIVQNSGAALQTSTANGIEISGTHQYGTFSISGNLATNMLLENGGNLLVLAGTEARDSTVGKGGAMQNLGQDSATKVNSGGQYTLGRSKDEFQALARAEDLQVAGGTAIVYAGTLADASVSGATGSLSLMTPRDNVTPVKLEGAVRITDSATLTLGNGVDTTLADLTAASRGSVWLNSNNSCAGNEMKNQATRLIRLPEVLERTGYGKAWIYRLINDGKFPAPVKIGSRAIAFVESEIDSWIQSVIETSRNNVA